MKMTKKKVLVTALAICLVAIISMGTLAWFNASDEVKNIFKVADTDGNGEPDFSLELWETDEYDNRVKEREYKDILPGDVLDKDPTIENTGNYDQYIRAYVKFSDAATLQAACTKYGLSTDLRTWLNVDSTVWDAVTDPSVGADGSITYCYYLKNTLGKMVGEETNKVQLFTTVTIPEKFVQADLSGANAVFGIDVKADALQTENTGTYAAEAFAYVGWDAFTDYPDYTVTTP